MKVLALTDHDETGLHASVGSDYHGPEEGCRDLGDLPELPYGCTPIWSSW